MFLKRLLSNAGLTESTSVDVTADEWAPVPAGATAEPTDTFEWLQGDGVSDQPIHLIATLDDAPIHLIPTVDDAIDVFAHFTAEELSVIEEQRREEQTCETSSPVLSGAPLPGPPSPPAARPVQQPDRPDRPCWRELLKSCGEHLSELELKIIREQLASS